MVVGMFKFSKEQGSINIAGVEIGGQPGELPMVLIGSIFYEGHKIVRDSSKGLFDKDEAEALIRRQEEMADVTGNPHIIDVVGSSPEALIRYVEFVSGVTESPFLVDGLSSKVRLPAIRHCIEVGLGDRAIYNSLDENVKDEELEALKYLGVEAAVLLAMNSRDLTVEGRIEILRGEGEKMGLLEAASEAGIKKILVDTAVLDAPSIGISARTIFEVKREFGLPAGCSPSNAMVTWRSLKKMGSRAFRSCLATSNAFLPILGANFVLYGPIKYVETVFPACAMIDAFVAYDARWRGGRPARSHPLYKMFRD
jgi:tetrahydromethanopterin S-methyltransferase subunit H